jgi:hypothetical protein
MEVTGKIRNKVNHKQEQELQTDTHAISCSSAGGGVMWVTFGLLLVTGPTTHEAQESEQLKEDPEEGYNIAQAL